MYNNVVLQICLIANKYYYEQNQFISNFMNNSLLKFLDISTYIKIYLKIVDCKSRKNKINYLYARRLLSKITFNNFANNANNLQTDRRRCSSSGN